ncbi:beta-lactamase/transpeptidase-like protein [Aspergillus novoparasiticus]|uniref:Beta-lactamase/transpeptidase-like protein n=1 Tax=Aspergillus novoparasiticus TaxID=986946 RepID=A0A5N6ER98_9EURO|nr:beta-lactamase/transpeptidase-like protein [Aspergillus novoparasiticus]
MSRTQILNPLAGATERILSAIPSIKKICAVSGAPGLSLAVVHEGQTLYVGHIGHRDVQSQLSPNDETRYSMNSMTKAMVAALVGIEVDQGKLHWDDKIKAHLPHFKSTAPEVENSATILDLLSHRSGITNFDSIWLGSQNNPLLGKDQALAVFGSLKPLLPFRTSFFYNNWGYEVVALVLQKVTGKDLATLLRENLFEPLHLSRTSTSWDPADDNNAVSYGVLSDLSPVEIDRPKIGRGQIMEAAGGVKTTITDLIAIYKSYVFAIKDQFDKGADSSPGSPFKQCRVIATNHARMPQPRLREEGYAAGWARSQLPNELGQVSLNPLIGPEPIAGKGSPSEIILYHHGSMPGSTSCVHLVPETQSAVIVLQNSLSTNDTADLCGQALLEALLGTPQRNDYVKIASDYTSIDLRQMDKIKHELDSTRDVLTPPENSTAYVGHYYNGLGNFCVEIFQDDDGSMKMRWQGLPIETYTLEHHHGDTFTWWMPYDEVASRGRYIMDFAAEYYVLRFSKGSDSTGIQMETLEWAWDPAMPHTPEVFTRRTS